MPHERYDMSAVRSWERTASGGVRLSAALTRSGVLVYRDAAGREIRECRPESEVFSSDSLRSMRGAPVTDLHPSALVTPSSWRDLAVGHVGDDVAREGLLFVSSLLVQDAGEIARIEAGERKEISAGYVCEVDEPPGTSPTGEPYDRVQREIRYNHVALGPEGWGRAGAEVSLRLDAAVEVVRGPLVARADSNATAGSSSAAQEQRMKKKLKVRGREIEIRADAADGMAEAQGAVAELEKKADADAAELGAVKAALMDALTKVASLEAKMAAASVATVPAAPAITEESIPEEVLDSALARRAVLVESARKVLGSDADLKGKKPLEIKRAVVAKRMPNVKFDSLSADTVDGMFRALVEANESARNDALAAAHEAAVRADEGTGNTPAREAKSLVDRLVAKGRAPLSGKVGG